MSHYFFDTSALVKRYVGEQGTAWVQSVLTPDAGHAIFIAHITQAELVSAAMRRQRAGQISPRTAHAVRLVVDRHANREYNQVALMASTVSLAEDLLEKYPLRAYDAVQLASALETNARLLAARLSALIFVSADTRLLAAAGAEGLATDDPNNHP